MATDDFFNPPELEVPDVFDSEVETLVLKAYKATIAGIEVLNNQVWARFEARGLDDPEVQLESQLWDYDIQAMKYHAGNIGLVSLLAIFDQWLERKHSKVFRNNGRSWKPRFEGLEKHFEKGPVSLAKLEEIVDARNSIIHHGGDPEFDWNGKRQVNERFLGFYEPDGQLRVAIEESLLADLASQLRSHVDFWVSKGHKKPPP
jgi:hypothetical protein